MAQVVDDYGSVVEGLENDIGEIEVEVFGGNPGVSRRIYALSREVIQFHQATQPLAGALESLTENGARDVDPEARVYQRDLRDRALRVTERVEGFRELLSNILTVNFTILGIQQTDQTKRISAWAAIVIVPTLIAGIYGMNFDYMPELHWGFGYPFALSLMALAALLLYLLFKRSEWL
jgi:magnesium transporter